MLLNITDGFESYSIDQAQIIHADCFKWMKLVPESSINAVVTDPPYGVKEFEPDQLNKRANGFGGVWRIPPSFDGCVRSPLPRFTALNITEREQMRDFFSDWAKLVFHIIKPGGHIFLASNAFLSQIVFASIMERGFEFRGEIIRLVRTMRGGDRPKNAEEEFSDVCSMPRSCYEPWGVFRKPLPNGMRVSDCLHEFQTGGLRRKLDGNPFEDVIPSERTPNKEKDIAGHPSLKPQSFLRKIVYSSLPLGEGIILDPFMGSGSTIAAANAIGYASIGVERLDEYYQMSKQSIKRLSMITVKDAQLELLIL